MELETGPSKFLLLSGTGVLCAGGIILVYQAKGGTGCCGSENEQDKAYKQNIESHKEKVKEFHGKTPDVHSSNKLSDSGQTLDIKNLKTEWLKFMKMDTLPDEQELKKLNNVEIMKQITTPIAKLFRNNLDQFDKDT